MKNQNNSRNKAKSNIIGSKKKKVYKIKNWREYNQSLINRYDITVWIKKGWVDVWEEHIPKRKRKQGGQRKYSNYAIECLFTIKYLFRLPYRGLEGLSRSLFKIITASKVSIPDYSTIQRRQKHVKVKSLFHTTNNKGKKTIDIVFDTTGLKVYGEGEWVVRQHGKSKQRMWRKIHIGINPDTQMIEAVETTENSYDDSELVKPLLSKIKKPINSFRGDGGYDKTGVYDALREDNIKKIIIPPRINARIWIHGNCKGDPHPRDKNLRMIRKLGKTKWKKQMGYHKRSLVETSIYRLKRIFGDSLSHRTLSNQQVEMAIKCRMLNMMTKMGMPESYEVLENIK